MKKYILTIDSGTTSNRCIIFDRNANIVSMAQKEFTQYFPKPGWVEQVPTEIWSTQIGVCVEAINKAGIDVEEIASIGITNQRETTVVWEKDTGNPIYNAIVWQCRRTSKYCDYLRENYADLIKEKCGLVVDAYFSATKLKWILDNVKGARERAKRGELLFGTIDTYLLYKLSGGKIHSTDYSNASRTMMFNINTLSWDDEILEILDIPKSMLPKVCDSSYEFGVSKKEFFGCEIPITGVCGDQQSALFGQLCTQRAMAKNTYGTGAFLLVNTGEEIVNSKNGLLSTIAWGIDGKITYALEGSIFVAGSAITWLRDGIRIIDSSEDSEYMATRVEDTNDVFVVPAFTGLGAPYWDQYARGLIIGITRGTNKYHIIRATLESIALLSNDVLRAMEEDMGYDIKELRVDGGASKNDFLMSFQSDVTNVLVKRPKLLEVTALGACYLAGLGINFWKDIDELNGLNKMEREFFPSSDREKFNSLITRWQKAVTASMGWA